MKVGDMVFGLLDEQRGLEVPGIILDTRRPARRHEDISSPYREIKVLWSSKSNPIGWWREDQLRVISAS